MGLQSAGVDQGAPARQTLAATARAASQFWKSAPGYMARETLHQKALTLPKKRLRIGAAAAEPPKPEFTHREIVSYYALASLRSAPEALRELRQILAVDGKSSLDDAAGRAKFRAILNSNDDRAKKLLLDDFEKTGLSVAATDFGQLVLLFTEANLSKYIFGLPEEGFVGAERSKVFPFRQKAGIEALRISEAGKQAREPLSGKLWVRASDQVPLRISLTSARREGSKNIRDEARVDYTPGAGRLILPASVSYRRFVNDELQVESIYQYSEWGPVNP